MNIKDIIIFLRELLLNEFTGSITIHASKGEVKKVDQHKVYRNEDLKGSKKE